MQRAADLQTTPGQDINMLSSGAFSYMSPPDRLFHTDPTNQNDTSPFNSKFPILRFNSGTKGSSVSSKSSKKTRSSKNSM